MQHNDQEYTAAHALAAGILAITIWSSTAIANKIAIASMDGLAVGVVRSLLAGMLAIAIASFLKFPFPHAASDRLLLVTSGIASFAAWPTLMSIGIEHTSVGHAALIMTLIPVFTVLFGAVVQRKVPKLGWWIGAVIALVATIALIFNKRDVGATSASIEGDLIVLLGGMVCAIGYIAGGKLSPKIGTTATTFWGLSIALAVLVPAFITIVDDTNWQAVTHSSWSAIAWLTLLSSLTGYALWFFALGHGGVARIGSLMFIMPVLTLFFAYLILDEVVTAFMLFICMCIIFGTYYAQKNAI